MAWVRVYSERADNLGMRLHIGIAVDKSKHTDALSICTLYSLYLNLTNYEIKTFLICTDTLELFDNISLAINALTGIICKRVIPDSFFHNESCFRPFSNGSYATYWKFHLIDAVPSNECLLYIDVDAIAIAKFDLNNYFNTMYCGMYSLAAVPAHRPVIERSHSLGLNSPFDYFNAGFFLYVAKKKINWREIAKQLAQQLEADDPLALVWHDQDILNYIFRNNYLKLSPCYNISSGWLLKTQHHPTNLTNTWINSIKKRAIIVHFSLGYLLKNKYHPFKYLYYAHAKRVVDDLLNLPGVLPNMNQTLDSFKDILKLSRPSMTNFLASLVISREFNLDLKDLRKLI